MIIVSKKIVGILAIASMLLAGVDTSHGAATAAGLGGVQKLPVIRHDTVFYENFKDIEKARQQWLLEDANMDGVTWTLCTSGMTPDFGYNLCYSRSTLKANDYAISPLFDLKADRSYRLAYFANMGYDEGDLEFWIGDAKSVAGMKIRVDSFHVDKTENGHLRSVVFKVPTAGKYCLGVRSVAPPGQMGGLYVDNIAITEEILSAAPKAVEGLVQVPGNNGTGMQLRWKNPAQTQAGGAISGNLTAIEIYKNYGSVAQAYTLSLAPGAEVLWTDPNPTPGKVSYHVYAVNAAGRSEVQSVNTFIGKDLPSAVQNIRTTLEGNKVTLTWDAPSEFGMNGGWYDQTNLTYLVARKPDYKVLAASATDKSFSEELNDLGYYYYEITAINADGQGAKAQSKGVKAGTFKSTPFHEDFEDAEAFRNLWSVLDVRKDKATWDRDPSRGNLQPAAAHYNWLLARNGWGEFTPPEADDWLFSPRIQLKKGKEYRLRYALKGVTFNDIHLRIYFGKTADPAEMTTNLIETLNISGTGTYENQSHTFIAPETDGFCIGFHYFDADAYLWIDDVYVEEIATEDLAVVNTKGSHTPKVGEAYVYTVSVENKGTAVARNYKVRLLDQADNVLAESAEQTRPHSVGRTNDIKISWTPANTSVSSLRAEVVWTSDLVPGNNIGTPIALRMQGDGFKAVLVGEGEIRSYTVPWYTYDQGFGQTVYPSSLLEGAMGKLYGLSYQVMVAADNGEAIKNQHFRVWVGETDRTDMAAGWFGPDKLTCMIDTVMDIEAGCYDWYLPFQRPFDYKGGNLVVCFEGRNAYGYLAHGIYFTCTETQWNAVHRSLYGNNRLMQMENLDDLYGKFFNMRPNTTFFFDVNNMGALQGKVSDKDGKALASVRVAVDGINLVKRTAEDGTYAYPYLPVGTRNLKLTAVGYEDASRAPVIADKQTTTLDITMQNRPVVKVRGVIAGSDNPHKGLASAELVLDGPSDYSITTDENGCYTIENVYGNLSYTAKINASGYAEYENAYAVGAVDLNADTIVISKMVNMPSAVSAYDKTSHALVEWTDPVPVAWLKLSKDEMYGAFGGASDQAYLVGHRYTTDYLKSKGITSSSSITKVRFFPCAIAKFSLCIYAGELGSESLVRQEELTVSNYEEWNEHKLLRAVDIDPSKNYIVALKVQQSSGSNPIGFDRGPAVANADLFSENNGHTWTSVGLTASGMNYNWLIQTYCSANPKDIPTDTIELLSVQPNSFKPDFLAEYGSSETEVVPMNMQADEAKSTESRYHMQILNKRKAHRAKKAAEAESKAVAGYKYEVYRLLNGAENLRDQWTKITSEPTAQMQVRDESWASLRDTMYRYAVRSFSEGAYSEYTFSRAVDKGKYVTVKIKVITNTGESAKGAEVKLQGLRNAYVAEVGEDDTVRLENVHFGTYDLSIRKEGYVSRVEKGVALNAGNHLLNTITLIEDVRPPLEFKAVDWVDSVKLTWEKPKRLKEVTLSKSGEDFSSGYGMNSGGDMKVGQRFTPEQLQEAGVDAYYINAISFWPAEVADFTIKVWKSDNIGEEKEVYSQTVDGTSVMLNQWNTVTLDQPVLINANQSYIIGYSAYMAARKYPIGADRGPVVAGGDLLFYNNQWSSFCGFSQGVYDFNWLIRARVCNIKGAVKTEATQETDYVYELYRLSEENIGKPNTWSKLSGADFKELSYVDKAWQDLPDADYCFAIFSRSQTGNASDTAFSAVLPKGQVSVVTVKASTNNGTSAQDALVTFTEEGGTKTYSDKIGADGQVKIPAVPKGAYTLTVRKPHFEDVEKAVSVTDAKSVFEDNELKEILEKPLIRAFKRDDENVFVNWYSPVQPGQFPHYITWSTDEFFTGIGQASGSFSASCAHRYLPSDLRENNVVGTYIHKIRFYPASNANNPTKGTYRVQVWEGESAVEVVNQAVPAESIKYNQWNEVVLKTPYYIDGTKTILVGYTANLSQGWGCGIDKGPAVRGRGNIINTNGVWAHITDLSPDLDYNWMIQAYCTDALEAGVASGKSAKAETSEDFVKSYTVYRMREADMTVPARWTMLKENTTDKALQDKHTNLPDAWYVYAVKATYATGESDYAFSESLGKGVSNETLERAGFELFDIAPNPSRGRFTAQLPFAGQVCVYALDGSLLHRSATAGGSQAFDLNLPAGTYVMTLTSNTRRAAARLVIAK